MQAHDVVCVHTMVGTLSGTDAYFERDGYVGPESHLGLGHDGSMLQWQDLMYEADANVQGGWHVLSIETADRGPGFPTWSGTNVPPWTAAQVDALVAWLVWVTAVETHRGCPITWRCHSLGIPRLLVPDTRADRRGIAYHRQGVDSYPTLYRPGWRQPDCERWSLSRGKVCPGDRRIEQLVRTVIPRVQALGPSVPLPPIEQELPDVFLYSAPNQPVFFCDGGVSVGINEPSDMATFTNQGVKHFKLDDDTFAKFRSRYPGA